MKQDPSIILPPVRACSTRQVPSYGIWDTPVTEPEPVPSGLNAIRGLHIELIASKAQREIWNRVIHSEHPKNTTTFIGVEIKYLIQWDHVFWGAEGYAIPAFFCRPQNKSDNLV